MFEVGCTRMAHGSLLKMRAKQVDPHANFVRLEPGTTKNKKGLEVTMYRRVLLECIKGKSPEDCLFTPQNGKPVRDFRGSWQKACVEAGLPGLHFHDLRRTAARNMRRGHISEKVAMGGVEDNFCFSPLRHRGQSGHRPRHEMLEKSQDQQRQDLEQALRLIRKVPRQRLAPVSAGRTVRRKNSKRTNKDIDFSYIYDIA